MPAPLSDEQDDEEREFLRLGLFAGLQGTFGLRWRSETLKHLTECSQTRPVTASVTLDTLAIARQNLRAVSVGPVRPQEVVSLQAVGTVSWTEGTPGQPGVRPDSVPLSGRGNTGIDDHLSEVRRNGRVGAPLQRYAGA